MHCADAFGWRRNTLQRLLQVLFGIEKEFLNQ
jgi:hypothetical protein